MPIPIPTCRSGKSALRTSAASASSSTAITLTALVIDLVMSTNITWFSTMYGLNYLVAQGYAVLALSVITVVSLSKAEPMKTILRTTEQHDLGKLMFAFVMLNIYLNFSQFLIIWSGNSPEEIPGTWTASAATGV